MAFRNRWLRAFALLLVGITTISVSAAQTLSLVEPNENEVFEHPIYRDSGGRLYARHILLNFEGLAIRARGEEVRSGAASAFLVASRTDLLRSLSLLAAQYGPFEMSAEYPNVPYGPETRTNIRTGETVTLTDVSQYTRLVFDTPVLLDEAVQYIGAQDGIRWAQPPSIVTLLREPNDPAYNTIVNSPGAPNNGDFAQWGLHRMNAAKAWGITNGRTDAPITIGVSDFWDYSPGSYTVSIVHPDLESDGLGGTDRLDNSLVGNRFGGHGTEVAGFAGAITDNAIWHASLGWNVKLRGAYTGDQAIRALACLGQPTSCHPVDIINASWISGNSPALENAVADALRLGITIVAGSGNSIGPGTSIPNGPTPFYPATYNFPTALNPNLSAQVIASTATDYYDNFAVGGPNNLPWNYSTGTDPINDRDRAFVDFAAPGFGVPYLTTTASGTTVIHSSAIGSGTSLSSPNTASLVSLLLSINGTLTPEQVYEALRESSLKVGQYAYTADANGDLWNRYMGYGRVDAYRAVKYVLETFGGTVGRSGFTVELPESITTKTGTTLTIRPGTRVAFAPSTSLTIGGTLVAQGVTFDEGTAGAGWAGIRFLGGSGGSISNSALRNVSGGAGGAAILTNGSSPSITSTTIQVKPGSYVFGVYSTGYNGQGARITTSTITGASGPVVAAAGGGYVSVYNSTIERPNTGTAVLAEGGGVVAFWPPPASAPYVGYDRVRGGRLLARGTGRIDAGASNTSQSQNHFCDSQAATLEVQSGGTIYARYNYWPGGNGPSSIVGSGSVYYSNNLGAAQCGLISSSEYYNSTEQAPSPSARGTEEEGEEALFTALQLREEGDYTGAVARLLEAYTSGGPVANTVLVELVRTYGERPLPTIPLFLEQASVTGSLRAQATAALGAIQANDGQTREAVSSFDRAARLRTVPEEAFYDQLAIVYTLIDGGEVDGALERLGQIEVVSEDAAQALQMAEIVLSMYTGVTEAGRTGATSSGEAQSNLTATSGFTMGRPYPNPTTSGVSVDLEVPQSAQVRVDVYDVMGRRVAVISDGALAEGRHQFRFDGAGLAGGVYAIRATVSTSDGSQTVIRPFTLAR